MKVVLRVLDLMSSQLQQRSFAEKIKFPELIGD